MQTLKIIYLLKLHLVKTVISFLILVLFSSCTNEQTNQNSNQIIKTSLFEFSYRLNSNNDFKCYLVSYHELNSNGEINAYRRENFNAVLLPYTNTESKLPSYFSLIENKFLNDTFLLNLDYNSPTLDHGNLFLIKLYRKDGSENVVVLNPLKKQNDLETFSSLLLNHSLIFSKSTHLPDTAFLTNQADKLYNKHIFPNHPLSPRPIKKPF